MTEEDLKKIEEFTQQRVDIAKKEILDDLLKKQTEVETQIKTSLDIGNVEIKTRMDYIQDKLTREVEGFKKDAERQSIQQQAKLNNVQKAVVASGIVKQNTKWE